MPESIVSSGLPAANRPRAASPLSTSTAAFRRSQTFLARLPDVAVFRLRLITVIAVAVLFFLVIPILNAAGVVPDYKLNVLGKYLSVAIVAVGIDLIWGYTGILSLCQAMFFCFGGYAIGMYMALHGPLDGEGIPRCLYVVSSEVSGMKLPFFWAPFRYLPIALILGLFLPGLAAFVFGYFAFRSRVRGVYFSIITQATTLGACLVFRRNETKLCGTNGLTNFVTLAGFDLQSPTVRLGLYFLTLLTLLLVYKLCRHVIQSRLGRLLVATRDNESRLRFAGYNPVNLKLFAFTLGAVIAALGGMLYTPQNPIITPFKMEPAESIMMVIWVAVGGRGTLTGAVLGAIVVNYLNSLLTTHIPAAWPFVQGALFVGVVLFAPDGLIGAWRKWRSRFASSVTKPNESLDAELAAAGVAMSEGARR
jgi:urea transport system permease protein